MSSPPPTHWRRKLHAFLHDTPDKATDIRSHEHRAAQIKAIFGFTPVESFEPSADHRASAADRLPFPHPAEITQPLGEIADFPHPLGGSSIPNAPFKSSAEALEVTQKSCPFLLGNDDPRAAFIAIWRFWRNWACSLDPRFARLPADTRIPDHTIWNHLNVTTAFQGALPGKEQEMSHPGEDLRPRLLLFSIGPVQDFIAAARSTRDLWSGSYLLSYLVSHALGRIAREIGPDHVIFPNLLDQPLIDLQLREIFATTSFNGTPVWDALEYTKERLPDLLTPSLPNRFMALLPAVHPATGKPVEEYAKEIADSVRQELKRIAGSVREKLHAEGDEKIFTFRADDFDRQTDRILDIQWQVMAIPESLDELQKAADALLPEENDQCGYTPRKAVRAILEMIRRPECKPQYGIKTETGWALLNALIAFLHDGVKSTRTFDAWRPGRWESGTPFNKDSLNGKEESVLQVHQGQEAGEKVASHCTEVFGMSRGTLKPGELLGASTLIKRFWHHTDLAAKLGLRPNELVKRHPMPNTHAIAMGSPFDDREESETEAERAHDDKYFAILALDGDEMGKWVSGSKTPPVAEMLSPKAKAFYQEHAPDFLKAPRAVTPSWHLQFAEALGNFSFHVVRRIVEAFDGRLLYAGGDDVLAMLPAKDALACARALRAAFRGEKAHLNEYVRGIPSDQGRNRRSDRKTPLFKLDHEGFLQLHPDSGAKFGDRGKLLSDPVEFPAMVPGPRADVSVGIAIAHFKAPLQDVVRAAQAAEKRAKRSPEEGGLGRGAVALTIYKRSGEILEWGTRWSIQKADEANEKTGHPTSDETAGYRLIHLLIEALASGRLNGRFPHKLEALLRPYLSDTLGTADDFETIFPDILARELDHCLDRNEGGSLEPDERNLFRDYWRELATDLGFQHRLKLLVNLLRTAAWTVRGVKNQNDPQPATA